MNSKLGSARNSGGDFGTSDSLRGSYSTRRPSAWASNSAMSPSQKKRLGAEGSRLAPAARSAAPGSRGLGAWQYFVLESVGCATLESYASFHRSSFRTRREAWIRLLLIIAT